MLTISHRTLRHGCLARWKSIFYLLPVLLVVLLTSPDPPVRAGLTQPPLYNGIYINLPSFSLTLFEAGRPVRVYPVAIGLAGGRPSAEGWKQTETPTGSFYIAVRDPRPSWEPPGWLSRERGWPSGYSVPWGHAGNPLGLRWLGLSLPSYGIHGNNNPQSIGSAISLGCVRMRNEDIAELFDLVRVGTPVIIGYETITIFREPGTLVPWLGVYPDIYRRSPVTSTGIWARLSQAGLGGLLSPEGFEILAGVSSNQPVVLPLPDPEAGTFPVWVNGSYVGHGKTAQGGARLLPAAAVLDALGIPWEHHAEGKDQWVSAENHLLRLISDDGGNGGDQQFLLADEVETRLGAQTAPVSFRDLVASVQGAAAVAVETINPDLRDSAEIEHPYFSGPLTGLRVDRLLASFLSLPLSTRTWLSDGGFFVPIEDLRQSFLGSRLQEYGQDLFFYGQPLQIYRRNGVRYVSMDSLAKTVGFRVNQTGPAAVTISP